MSDDELHHEPIAVLDFLVVTAPLEIEYATVVPLDAEPAMTNTGVGVAAWAGVTNNRAAATPAAAARPES